MNINLDTIINETVEAVAEIPAKPKKVRKPKAEKPVLTDKQILVLNAIINLVDGKFVNPLENKKGLSGVITSLTKRGLVLRTVGDKKAVTYSITDQGKALLN